MKKKLSLLLGALLISTTTLTMAQADKPISIIVTVPPGGSSDALARVAANTLSEKIKRPVVVENVTGAGGLVGMQRFLRTRNDGNTLLFINQALVIIPHLQQNSTYDPIKDFKPLGIVASVPMMLSVSNGFKAQDVKSLISTMKEKPGEINFGSGGPGTTAHFAEALFVKLADAKAELVQYRGSGPALVDLMAGTIDAVIDQTVTMASLHADKRVRALAVTGDKRVEQAPDVPTFTEAGLPSFDLEIWNGLFAAAGTPPEALAELNQAIASVVTDPEFIEKIKGFGGTVPQGDKQGPEALKQLVIKDAERVKGLSAQGAFGAQK